MKRKVLIALGVAGVLLGLTAFSPSTPATEMDFFPVDDFVGSLDEADAQASKSRGEEGQGGGGNAAKVGDRAAGLGSGWAIPLTVFIAGVLLTAALVSRNVGAAVGVVLVAMIALIFFADPDSIVDFAEGVGNAVF